MISMEKKFFKLQGGNAMSIIEHSESWCQKYRLNYRDRSKVRWPGNRSLAVRVNVALEIFGTGSAVASGSKEGIGGLSARDEYNFEVGVWRVLDILVDHKLPATFFVSGSAVTKYPNVLKTVADEGFEIAAHGYEQGLSAASVSEEREEEEVVLCTDLLRAINDEPGGWVSPGGVCTQRTIDALIRAGYLWHGDLQDDDIPYVLETGAGSIVEIPHRSQSTNDFSIFASRDVHGAVRSLRSVEQAKSYFAEAFLAYKSTSEREGLLSLEFGIHPFSSCIPDRIVALDWILSYISNQDDIWVTTNLDMARWWRENMKIDSQFFSQ